MAVIAKVQIASIYSVQRQPRFGLLVRALPITGPSVGPPTTVMNVSMVHASRMIGLSYLRRRRIQQLSLLLSDAIYRPMQQKHC